MRAENGDKLVISYSDERERTKYSMNCYASRDFLRVSAFALAKHLLVLVQMRLHWNGWLIKVQALAVC